MIENIDPFRIMKMLGIKKKDRLDCLDMIQSVRNEVMRVKVLKDKK